MPEKLFRQESAEVADALSRVAWAATDAARAHQDAGGDDEEPSAQAARTAMVDKMKNGWRQPRPPRAKREPAPPGVLPPLGDDGFDPAEHSAASLFARRTGRKP